MIEQEPQTEVPSQLGWYLYGALQTTVLFISLYRWFSTEHWNFWAGFKELLWAVIPVLNFTYVLDWWL